MSECKMFVNDVNFGNAAYACCVIVGRIIYETHLLMHVKMCMDAHFFVQSFFSQAHTLQLVNPTAHRTEIENLPILNPDKLGHF